MSDHDTPPEPPDTWLEAANEADYEFYEATTPEPSYRWAGGYGYSHSGPVMLEVLAVVQDAEISVQTFAAGAAPPAQFRKTFLLRELVGMVIDPDQPPVELPLTLAIEDAERVIGVNDKPSSFNGYSANGQAWIGATTLSDGREIILRDPTGIRPTQLATCTNWAMPDHGPSTP